MNYILHVPRKCRPILCPYGVWEGREGGDTELIGLRWKEYNLL